MKARRATLVQPRPKPLPMPDPEPRFRKGARVLVLDGLSRGRIGIVRGRGITEFGNEPTWRVYFDAILNERTIRETFLTEAPLA